MATLPFNILYEDNHLLVVDKPAGMLTQPTELEEESLEVLLKQWLIETYNKPGKAFLGVVHRLDKPVSGIVIFAKTSKALSRLNASIRDKEMKKTYCALVEGTPKKSEATLENYLRQDDYRAYICKENEYGAKFARLHYKTLKSFGTRSLIEVELETGRYHQIRAQLSSIGNPVVGDRKYGSEHQLSNNTIALHHVRMEIKHPVTLVLLSFEAPLPERLKLEE